VKKKEKDLKIIKSIKELRTVLDGIQGKTGLVPTMGALHKGHLSLIERCVSENDFNIVSIFVNPTQFGPKEDFDKYPRTLEADVKMCEQAGVDVVFAPSSSEMYKNTMDTTLVCPPYAAVDKLCGKSRVGHFDGVATVVSKLFNITSCDRAYFGKKDAQQLFIIKKMVDDLNFNVEIISCDIVREEDGLAMSSRNTYLTSQNRTEALKLSKALKCVKDLYAKGENSVKALTDAALSVMRGLDVEYFEICDLNTFHEADNIIKQDVENIALAAVNIYQGENSEAKNRVRLIDNIEL